MNNSPGYSCPGTVEFGCGVSAKLPQLIQQYASVVVITTTDESRHVDLLAAVAAATNTTILRSQGEPSVATAQWATAAVVAAKADCIVALGGGSILDLAKAAAALATNPKDIMTYLEVVGAGQPLTVEPLPVIALPTTFGTGSEVTRNAVLAVPQHQRKVSLRHASMVPKIALIDPELAIGVPPAAAAAAGIDALIHVFEAYVSNSPCTGLDERSLQAMQNGFTALPKLVHDPDTASREIFAQVSLCGGLCIANAKLGAVHGLAGVLGGMLAAGHGAICGALFSAVVWQNITVLNDEVAVTRFAEIAALVGCDVEQLADYLAELATKINLASLGELGVEPASHAKIAAAAQSSSSMRGNPVALSQAQLIEILERAH